ncbi:DUF1707 domain-containing protein [Thermobifida halotolerans]|uniref:DUF1707 domain-containing protein n=1 Tax=Thermobifida halotolerans TaxID=483545 RepID=A0A399FX10_9ACTN|nr:DUF1707 domain-containing protein [Thermobifida halotolerans]UOE18343.1 DUF1707 domain-containing protein [Thermobifida halotolerans]
MSGSSPHIRASDADREGVAERLREHFAQGRLDDDELAERMEAVYRARTRGELALLTEDLPGRDLADLPGLVASALPRTRGDAGLPVPFGYWLVGGGMNTLLLVVEMIVFVALGADLAWYLAAVGLWAVIMGVVALGVQRTRRG